MRMQHVSTGRGRGRGHLSPGPPAASTKLSYWPSQGALSCEKRKESTSPPPERDREIQPNVPSVVYDPTSGRMYDVGEYLGKGGFAWCYAAIDQETRITYALKIIGKFRLTRQHHRDKVEREIRIHRRLQHPNIVRLHSSFEDLNNVYILLELCPRKSLVNVVKTRGRLSEPEAAHYLRHLCQAVIYLHEDESVLHRDLKLGNMLLSADMSIKLGDFGLASTYEEIQQYYKEKGSVSICGTPNYIAPEVLQRRGHSLKTEAWAMGCVLYAMLVGRPPFETAVLEETYERIQKCDYRLPAQMEQQLSNEAKDLIHCLLHAEPGARPTPIDVMKHPFIYRNRCIRMHPDFCSRPPLDHEILPATVQNNNNTVLQPHHTSSRQDLISSGGDARLSLKPAKSSQMHFADENIGFALIDDGSPPSSRSRSRQRLKAAQQQQNNGTAATNTSSRNHHGSTPAIIEQTQNGYSCALGGFGHIGQEREQHTGSVFYNEMCDQYKQQITGSSQPSLAPLAHLDTLDARSTPSPSEVIKTQMEQYCVIDQQRQHQQSYKSPTSSAQFWSDGQQHGVSDNLSATSWLGNAPGASGPRGSTSSTGSGDSGLGSDPSPPHQTFSGEPLLVESLLARLFDRYARLLNSACENSRGVIQSSADGCGSSYIAKWIDYTNRYGFGCQLSDGTRSIKFNNDTVLSVSQDMKLFRFWPFPSRPDISKYWRPDEDGHPADMQHYVQLAKMFIDYMENNLVQGGENVRYPSSYDTDPQQLRGIYAFARADSHIAIMLTDGTVQLNYFVEHVKLCFSGTTDGGVTVTVIDPNRRQYSFVLEEWDGGVNGSSKHQHANNNISVLNTGYRTLMQRAVVVLEQQRKALLQLCGSSSGVRMSSKLDKYCKQQTSAAAYQYCCTQC